MADTNYELILHRLDEISRKQDTFNNKVDELTIDLTKMRSIEHTVDNIKEWKEKHQEAISTSELKEFKVWKQNMEELMSPTQLKHYIKEHEGFKTFKIQSMMIWVVVQVLMSIGIFWDRLFT